MPATANARSARSVRLLVSAIVLVETMFFAAITPLLPYYAHQLHLTKASAGVLVAAYPAGTLLASLPAGALAVRIGSRRTVLVGLALLAGSSVAFGVAHSVTALDVARFVQGVGAAASWTGGFTWLVSMTPPARRGEAIGGAFGAAIGGALFGPVLGAAANAIGPKPVFAAVAVTALALAALVARAPRAPQPVRSRGWLADAARESRLVAGGWLIVLVGLFFGVLDVLLPLRLHNLGAASGVIAATFLFASAVSAFTSPFVGRWSDRRGRLAPARAGLAAAVVVALALPAIGSAPGLVALAILGGPLVDLLWVPGMALVSDGAEAAGIDQAFGFAIMNLAWAGAAMAGSGIGGSLAKATADAVAYGLVAALCAVTLLGLAARARTQASR